MNRPGAPPSDSTTKPHLGSATLADAERIARGAIGADPGGYRAELMAMIARARQLMEPARPTWR